jgi:asparagine synthetase B (glutamine-hydrolysing)
LGDRKKIAASLGATGADRGEVGEQLGARLEARGLEGLYTVRGPMAYCGGDLEGMTLHSMRDKVGTIPLRFFQDSGRLLVSSNGEWLIEAADRPEIRESRLRQSLTLDFDSSREGFFSNVYRILPREHLEWTSANSHPDSRRYWHPDTSPVEDIEGLSRAVESELRHILELYSPEQAAISMSGGVDSTLLAAVYREVHRNQRIETVSMVCRDSDVFDERHEIVSVSKQIPVEHHLFDVSELWPLKEPRFYEAYTSNGPNFYILEFPEVRFRSWVVERLGLDELIVGNGAELAFSSPIQDWICASFRNPDQLRWLWENQKVPLRQIVEESLKNPFRGTEVELSLRRLIRKLRSQESWENATNWLTFEPWKPSARDSVPGDKSPGRERLDYLDSWIWEVFTRLRVRSGRRLDLTQHFPYLDEKVLQYGLQLPWRSRANKSLLRGMAVNYMSEELAQRDYYQRANSMTAKTYLAEGEEILDSLFSPSKLAERGIIDDSMFRQTFGEAQSRIRSRGIDSITQTALLWLTIAAEIWMRAYPTSSD